MRQCSAGKRTQIKPNSEDATQHKRQQKVKYQNCAQAEKRPGQGKALIVMVNILIGNEQKAQAQRPKERKEVIRAFEIHDE